MFGVGKKVEAVRKALHDALLARANALVQSKKDTLWEARALVLLDLADIIRRLTIEPVSDEEAVL